MDTTKTTTEMEALKNRLQATWSAGDFGRIATSFAGGAADIVESLKLGAGTKVLDVACGTGNLAVPAARTGAEVTGLDIVPELIEQARRNAAAEGLDARFDVGDAEAMPYEDGAFDVVMSLYGAMFGPRPEVVVSELIRVCRPGGLIAMANWTQEGLIGQMFKVTGKHLSPPAGMPSPGLWGDEETVRERFADRVSQLTLTRRTMDFNLPFGPAEVVDHFRKFYGPTLKAFAALDEDFRTRLRLDLEELWTANNNATDGTTSVSVEYLDVRAVV